ncbi:hypothetical protein [Acinetobacter bereziniae]|uniref:hypothetical protein n=1 Tax=Acinetobacter bereziniae TaxID=106648 RepID=UPI00125F142E|nr:hypothetical protein [Acinetobacter bereziniae]
MKDKVKKLYFTNDFSLSNVQKIQGDGWIIRNAQLAKSDSFVEKADEYGGDVPERYKTNTGKVTVDLDIHTSPELQQAIDDAVAECGKVAAERDDALEQLQVAQSELIAFQNNLDAMKARITELEANADKTDEEKPKTTKTK